MASLIPSRGGIKVEASDLKSLAAAAPQNASHQGYLIKQGKTNTSSMKSRYFLLTSNTLFYYTNETCSDCIGVVLLEGSDVQAAGTGLVITSAGGRTWRLRAVDEGDCAAWAKALAQAQFRALQQQIKSQGDVPVRCDPKTARHDTPAIPPSPLPNPSSD